MTHLPLWTCSTLGGLPDVRRGRGRRVARTRDQTPYHPAATPSRPPVRTGLQLAAEFPEFGVEAEVDAGSEVRPAGAATGATLGADLPLRHEYVPGPPQRPGLIVVDQRLGEIPQRPVLPGVARDLEVRLGPLLRRLRGEPRVPQYGEEPVPDARLGQPALQPRLLLGGQAPEACQVLRVLESRDELDLPELHRLEPGRRGQLVAEREEVLRGHAVDHVDLPHQHLLDGAAPVQPQPRLVRVAGSCRT